MKISVSITRDPIALAPPAGTDARAGAVVEFAGVVRGEEGGRQIEALEYEAYEAMAVAEMTRILEALAASHPCLTTDLVHRIGRVPVGEAAIVVRITARHRAEAFTLLSDFMDRLKADVPIWKVAP